MEFSFMNSKKEEVKVFLPEEELDKETLKQIKNLSNNPTVNHPRFMPDTHKGYGCCVGFTSLIKNGLIPLYVGGDIGCGISCIPLNLEIKEKKIPKIEKAIRQVVPVGNGNDKVNLENISTEDDWNLLFNECNLQIENLYKVFPEYGKIEYNKNWYINLCKKIKTDMDYDIRSLGTLGGGNHYIELNKSNNGKIYATVHSGSRNLGQKVCKYHQKILNIKSKFDWDIFEKKVRKMKKLVKGKKNRKDAEDDIYKKMQEEITVPYLQNKEMFDYLVDMIFTQKYASLNRKIMLRQILNVIGLDFNSNQIIETIHNYIDFDRMILRKGAVSAEENELCIVSLNMKDGILICRGKGNKDWNYSSAHGCGRILNRSESSRLNLKKFKEEMKNVYSTCIVKETLDESPMAYRDVELIKKCLGNSVDIIEQLRPIINIKGL